MSPTGVRTPGSGGSEPPLLTGLFHGPRDLRHMFNFPNPQVPELRDGDSLGLSSISLDTCWLVPAARPAL